MARRRPLRFRVEDVDGRAVRVRRWYLAFVVGGILLVVLGLLAVPFYVTTTPSFCYNCHIMEPFVDSWEKSTHRKFGCDECHVRPGAVNRIVNQVVVTQNVYMNVIGQAEMPEQIRSATNQNCLQSECHSLNRKASTSGDLKIPHRQHVRLRDLQCKDCHFNVIHTVDGGTPVPPMGVCAMCHDGKEAPNECSTCHEEPPAAEEEHPGLALEEHGEIAGGRIRDCFRCHHSDQQFCARSGCHDPETFQEIIEEETMKERFH